MMGLVDEDGVGNPGSGGDVARVLRPGNLRGLQVYDLGKQQVIALRIMESRRTSIRPPSRSPRKGASRSPRARIRSCSSPW